MTPSRHHVTAAAHQRLPHANPLSEAQMVELADWALRWTDRSQASTAIDIGCGPGSFSIALAVRASVRIRAIDVNPAFLQRARSAAQESSLVGTIDFVERSLQDDEGEPFDLVVCIGSSGALGSPRDALRRCTELLARDGTLVFAELVWATEPADEFLSFLEIERAHYWFQSDGEQVFHGCGLQIHHQCEASASSWDGYERAVLEGRLALAASLPSEQAEALRSRAQRWYKSYQEYGRSSFGFNAYVARRAEAS